MSLWGVPGGDVQPTLTVRQQVFDRDSHVCAGLGVAELEHDDLTVQHRLNRGMGGDPDVNDVQWLMALCLRCNVRLEHDAKLAALGRRWGWKLISGETPNQVSVWYAWARQWRRLDESGGFIVTTGRTGPAMPDDPFAGWREEA